MADLDLIVNFKVNDQARGAFNRFRKDLGGFKKELEGVGGIGARTLGGNLAAGLRQAGTAMTDLSRSGARVFAPILSQGIDFERTMAEVLAFGGTKFAPFMEQLTALARQLGRDTEFTAVQAGQAMRQLAQAGFEPLQIMKQLPQVLTLAKAGSIDLTTAARIMTATIGQFGFAAEDSTKVVDLLAAVSTSTSTNIVQLGQALAKAGSNADLMGLSLESTLLALGVMGKTAITGGTAGRQFSAVLQGMAKLTLPQYRDALKAVGLDQKQLADNLNNDRIRAAFQQFRDVFKEFSGTTQLAAAMKIFGRVGGRGFSNLLKQLQPDKEGIIAFDKIQEAIDNFTGSGQRMASIMSDTSRGAIFRMTSALSELALTIADDLLPALRPLIEDATAAIKVFSGWAKENPALVGGLAKLGLGIVGTGLVLGPVLSSMASLVQLFTAAKIAAPFVIGAFRKLGTSALVTSEGLSAARLGFISTASAILGIGAALIIATKLLGDYFDEQKRVAGIVEAGGRTKVRAAASLKDLTAAERVQLEQDKKRQKALVKELGSFSTKAVNFLTGGDEFFGVDTGLRGNKKILEDLDKVEARIDALQQKGLARGAFRRQDEGFIGPVQESFEMTKAMENFMSKITEGNFGKAVQIVIDQRAIDAGVNVEVLGAAGEGL